MKYHLLVTLASLAIICTSFAQEGTAALNLKPKDIKSLQIELKPGEPVRMNIFFTKAKLSEAQELITANLDKPFNIFMEGKLVVTPRIKYPLYYKNQFIVLRFPTISAAAHCAELLVPTQ